MIPQAVQAAIEAAGVTLAGIQESAALALPLQEILDIAGTGRAAFFRFLNLVRSKIPGISRSQAATYFRQARYWSNQNQVLGQYGPNVPLDPRLARTSVDKSGVGAQFGIFRTQVEVVLTDPATGKSKEYSFYVRTEGPPSISQLYADAIYEMEDVLSRSPGIGGRNDIETYNISYRIVDYTRFIEGV